MSAALREAGKHSGFWYLTAGFFVCGFQIAFISIHLPVYLRDLNLPLTVAGWALALIGLFNIFGSFTAGYLGARFSKKYVLSSIYFLRAVVIGMFLLLPVSPLSVYLFAAGIGFLWLGTVPLTNGLVGQIFGVRYVSTLFGIVFLSHQVGSFLGVWLGGYLFDMTGSYASRVDRDHRSKSPGGRAQPADRRAAGCASLVCRCDDMSPGAEARVHSCGDATRRMVLATA